MAANILELLHSSTKLSKGDTGYLNHFIESCLEHGVFYLKETDDVTIKTINTCLSSSIEREKGLAVLLSFLTQIPSDVFSKNAVSWMVTCNKTCQRTDEVIDGLSLKVLTKLLALSVKFPDLNKEAAKQVVPKFLLDHVKRRNKVPVSTELLECLEACMMHYSGPSGEYRTDIEKLLASTVEAKPEVVSSAAKCVPLMTRVGGGGKQGTSHKTSWQRLQLQLINHLHSLLDGVYEHINLQPEVPESNSSEFHLMPEPVQEKDVLLKIQRLGRRFTTVSQFLQAMLLEQFPVSKQVAVDAVLDVVAHAQRPTQSAFGTTREALAVLVVLPDIQVASIHLLESLVLCLGRSLVPWGGLVTHLCSQVTVWTQQQRSDWPYAMEKPYRKTRLAVYNCLYAWLSVAGPSSQAEVLLNKPLAAVLADVQSQKPSVKLKVGSKSHKGKKKQQMLVSAEDRSEKLVDRFANCQLCVGALRTLNELARAAVWLIKPDTYLSIKKAVVALLTGGELPVPYDDEDCLSTLYQLLLTLCLEPHPSAVPPLSLASAVFSTGLHHPATKVKTTCKEALSCLDKIIHPTCATLYFPLRQETLKTLVRERTESEDSEMILDFKRRRIDSDGEESRTSVTAVVDENDDKFSVVSVIGEQSEEFQMEKLVYDSDDSVCILETMPIESTQQEKEISVGNEYIEIDIQSNIVEEKLPSVHSDCEKQQKSLNSNYGIQQSNNSSDPLQDELTSDTHISHENASTVVLDKPEAMEQLDEDISEMLTDFKDEIDNN